jgi:hypothetical protein
LKHGAVAAEAKLAERENRLSRIHLVAIDGRPVKVEIAPDNPNESVEATVFLVSVWLAEMLGSGEIDDATHLVMTREVQAWANDTRSVKAVQS